MNSQMAMAAHALAMQDSTMHILMVGRKETKNESKNLDSLEGFHLQQ